MKWRGRRGSANIEDRRTASRTTGRGGFGPFVFGRSRGSSTGFGGGSSRAPRGRARVGGVGLIVVVLIAMFLGVDPTLLLNGSGGLGGGGLMAPERSGAPAPQLNEADREAGEFVSVVLADTEEVWAEIFPRELGAPYDPPVLVLFAGLTQSACGSANAATGPFYCPADRKIYLDTDFFSVLSRRLGAKGDFAQAYVVAHEVAHHVQNEIGLLGEANRARGAASRVEANEISVRVELMADCLAGVWAAQAQRRFGSLEPGDIEEAMLAAEKIGDDALQKGAGQVVRPDSFTHGTSAQRARWFERGLDGGSVAACDTFKADRL